MLVLTRDVSHICFPYKDYWIMGLTLAASLLSPNVGLAVWMIVTFGLLLGLLGRFAWGPITKAMEEREERISESLNRAESAVMQAKEIERSGASKIKEAEKEAQKLLKSAREAAQRREEEAREKEQVLLTTMREQAKQDIERERQQAIESIRKEVTELAMLAAAHVIGKTVDEEKQRTMVSEFLDHLPKN